MGEKRKSQPKELSAKKARSQKQSTKDSTGKAATTEPGHTAIPYPKSVSGSSFTECTAKLTVTLAPMYSCDHLAGIHEALNNMLLHYVPQVRGVVLAYSKVKPRSDTALMFFDSPYGQLEVSARLLLWRPIAGMTLKGQINVQSPDHIGMLLWDTFNASIPASFIPKDKYEWRPFNDDEIAARALPTYNQTDAVGDGELEDESGNNSEADVAMPVLGGNDGDVPASPFTSGNRYGSGEWVVKGTSQSVGSEGCLEFVVVDVIRANEVLSVTGALR
ncbi:hypothetical protein H4S07_001578 [Coemansia furcata]|uniref:Uncharacterized protein n=1 Tax=Coemansia furcata TaxID=417177 RepID=A0ACC1LMZ8_9FUNG|nr:hypothetical protein H4S07_001578 [Coemansia furcata]